MGFGVYALGFRLRALGPLVVFHIDQPADEMHRAGLTCALAIPVYIYKLLCFRITTNCLRPPLKNIAIFFLISYKL